MFKKTQQHKHKLLITLNYHIIMYRYIQNVNCTWSNCTLMLTEKLFPENTSWLPDCSSEMFIPVNTAKEVFILLNCYEVKCYLCCSIPCLIKPLFTRTKLIYLFFFSACDGTALRRDLDKTICTSPFQLNSSTNLC